MPKTVYLTDCEAELVCHLIDGGWISGTFEIDRAIPQGGCREAGARVAIYGLIRKGLLIRDAINRNYVTGRPAACREAWEKWREAHPAWEYGDFEL